MNGQLVTFAPPFDIYHGGQLGFSHNDTELVIHTEAAQWSGTARAEKRKCLNNGFNREMTEKVQACFKRGWLRLGIGI